MGPAPHNPPTYPGYSLYCQGDAEEAALFNKALVASASVASLKGCSQPGEEDQVIGDSATTLGPSVDVSHISANGSFRFAKNAVSTNADGTFGGKFHAQSEELKDNQYLTEQYPAEMLKGVFLPFGTFKTWWDVFTLTFVIYTAVMLPMTLSFIPSSLPVPIFMVMLELLMDIVFIIDIVLSFNTAYVKAGECILVIDRKEIARNYLKFWFPIDVAGSLPMDLILFFIDLARGNSSFGGGGGGDSGSAVALVKILKIPKMMRLGRLFRFLSRFEGSPFPP